MRFFITGTAGFIGFHLAQRLLHDGHVVFGVDGITSYYDTALKRRRHHILSRLKNFTQREVMLDERDALEAAYEQAAPDIVVHLAGQPGVRYSLENPRSYVDSNVSGTLNVLELARRRPPSHLLFASSSSVYGLDAQAPFSEDDHARRPLTLYAATKQASEMIAHSYAHLFDIPSTALRFFTVYGPWGRPDMAPFKFARLITDGAPIELFNQGRMRRDFTYIDDVVEAVVRLISVIPPKPNDREDDSRLEALDSLSSVAPYRVVNIGNSEPVELLDFVSELERVIGRKAIRHNLGMQAGDVVQTHADTRLLEALTGFRPSTPLAFGIAKFIAWYRDEYSSIALEN